MFILPVHAQPFAEAGFPMSMGAAHTWQWLLAPLRLPLTLLATLLVFLLVRAVLASSTRSRLLGLRTDKGVPVALSEKPSAADTVPTSPTSAAPPSTRSWFGFGLKLSWETLPALPSLPSATDLPITLSGPPPPAMRGRNVYRGGRGVGFNVAHTPRRPEAALASRARVEVEAPLPAIYESQTPVSMAKIIMSRHTYRRPSAPAPRRSPSASTPAMSYTRRPPSPELEAHTRSASV